MCAFVGGYTGGYIKISHQVSDCFDMQGLTRAYTVRVTHIDDRGVCTLAADGDNGVIQIVTARIVNRLLGNGKIKRVFQVVKCF